MRLIVISNCITVLLRFIALTPSLPIRLPTIMLSTMTPNAPESVMSIDELRYLQNRELSSFLSKVFICLFYLLSKNPMPAIALRKRSM